MEMLHLVVWAQEGNLTSPGLSYHLEVTLIVTIQEGVLSNICKAFGYVWHIAYAK